jgi:hypothetical protein
METDLRNICTLYEDFFPWNVQLQNVGRADIFFTVSISAELNMYNAAH